MTFGPSHAMQTSYKYAARLNSFKNGVTNDASPAQRGVMGLLSRAAQVPGLNAVDLNFPDHLEAVELKDMRRHLDGLPTVAPLAEFFC